MPQPPDPQLEEIKEQNAQIIALLTQLNMGIKALHQSANDTADQRGDTAPQTTP